MAVGDYIRCKRLPFASLRQLAKDIGISASYLSDVENDRRKISRQMAMRITVALFRYTGGNVHKMFDVMLMTAGLLNPERECLTRLYKSAFPLVTGSGLCCTIMPHNGDQVLINVSFNDVYEALYGELDAYIHGIDQPNMLEQTQAIDDEGV